MGKEIEGMKRGKGKKQGRERGRGLAVAILAAACIGLAACAPGACSRGGETVTLTLAMFGYDAEAARQAEEFNRSHRDSRIVVEQYRRSTLPEEDGIARLQREIMTGKGPDLIDFGADYAASDIMGGYTEDLSPYLEAEQSGDGLDYFENILDAFRYRGKLYAMPVSFTLRTFAGSRAALGDRESWNIREMAECYDARVEGCILYPGETKKDVFGTFLNGSMDCYVDWEQGTCRFDSDDFAQALVFADQFPANLQITEEDSVRGIFSGGGALLLPLRLNGIYGICEAEAVFNTADVCYIGFPVEEGCGTVISPSATMLAISANSGHKDAAWEFVAGFLRAEYQAGLRQGFPIRRSALEEKLAQNFETEYTEDAEGNPVPLVKHRILFEGEEPVEIFRITEQQADKLRKLIGTATIGSAGDPELYRILLEEADAFFHGDRSPEETCRIMQSRAMLFVSERVR